MTIQENFKGIRNDIGSKHISPEFVFDATNVNNDSIVGMDSILYPERVNENIAFSPIDVITDLTDATLYTIHGDSGATTSTGLTIHDRAMSVYNGGPYTLATNGLTVHDYVFCFWWDGYDSTNPSQTVLIGSGFDMRVPYFAKAAAPNIEVGQSNTFGISNTNQYTGITPGLHHYAVFVNNSTSTIQLYLDGNLQTPIFNSNGNSGNVSLTPTVLRTNGNFFDFSIIDLSTLGAYTHQQIADYLWNNTFKANTFEFVYEYPLRGAAINGLVEYRYLDGDLIPHTQDIYVSESSVYKNLNQSAISIYTGLTPGLCQFTTFNNKLLIVNGKDYPLWYNGATGNFYQMGAPEANQGSVGGVLNGTFYYALSYTTAGGDDILGTVSNTITTNGRKIALTLPIPYDASIVGMKLYRTTAGGSQLKLLHTFTSPTPLTYEDNDLDSALGEDIGAINNEMIRPYFVESVFDKIIMSVVDKYPTQCFIGESGIEVIDPSSNFIDLANQASDNTPIVGMELDYNQIVLGTHRNMILIDPSTDPATVTFTRSNVGVLNGYSMCRVPANGTFDGGVMFVSTMADVRLLSGYKAIIPETVNDISTDNMAQVIQGTFPDMARSVNRMNSAFYDYKYHLIVGEIMWVFDIRTQSWWKYDVRSENYVSSPTCFGISGGTLYTGQSDGWIERMYADIQYNGEDVVSSIESGTMTVNDAYKFMKDWKFWLYTSPNTELNVKIILDDDIANAIEATFNVGEGYFDPMHFSGIFYDIGASTEDYRNFNISRMARWVKFILKCNSGRLYFRGYDAGVEVLRNKEA